MRNHASGIIASATPGRNALLLISLSVGYRTFPAKRAGTAVLNIYTILLSVALV